MTQNLLFLLHADLQKELLTNVLCTASYKVKVKWNQVLFALPKNRIFRNSFNRNALYEAFQIFSLEDQDQVNRKLLKLCDCHKLVFPNESNHPVAQKCEVKVHSQHTCWHWHSDSGNILLAGVCVCVLKWRAAWRHQGGCWQWNIVMSPTRMMGAVRVQLSLHVTFTSLSLHVSGSMNQHFCCIS